MPRPERPLDPEAGVVQRFASELRQLRQAAGAPGYRELARLAHYSATTLAQAARGDALPSLAVTLAYVRACGGDEAEWKARWRAVHAELGSGPETDRCESRAGGPAPYVGLAGYQVEDAARFFGRDRLLTSVRERLSRQRFVVVVGASGSGKSSFLRAGLVANARVEGDRWLPVLCTPGAHPLHECAVRLAAALRVTPGRLAAEFAEDPATLGLAARQLLAIRESDGEVLLVVDQFEEVFTLCTDERERDAFVDTLVAASADDGRTRVVLGLRADFVAHCARHPRLVEALQDAQILVGPMSNEDLRDTIVEPAARAGLIVETSLVTTVLDEADGRPGALPLVSHALWETWRRRRGAALRLADYHAVGGLGGAIAQSADTVFCDLTLELQRVARDIMLRLIALGEGTEDTRRRVPRTELGDEPATATVLDRLAAARLVTVAADTVEIAHEALIAAWPRLREWLAADRELLRAHRRFTDAAVEWDRNGRDEGYLYRGTRLATWQDREPYTLNDTEHAFLTAGTARQERERLTRRHRLRLTLAGLVAAVVVVSLLAVLALIQAVRAANDRQIALSRQLAASARSQLATDPELALLLAIRAVEKRSTNEADAVLRQAVVDSRERATVPTGQGEVRGVAFSPDGRRLVTGGTDGTVKVWSPPPSAAPWPKPTVLRGHQGAVWCTPAFSPDGRHIATGGVDSTVRIWDPTGGTAPVVLRGHRGPIGAVAFSPDGRLLASSSDDGVRLWDLTGLADPILLTGHGDRVYGLTFSSDGKYLAGSGNSDGTVRIWDRAQSYREDVVLHGAEGSQGQLAFTPGGHTIVSSSRDGVRFWDASGHHQPTVLRGHSGVVLSVAVSADGHAIASGGQDGTIRVYGAATDTNALVLRGHHGEVWSVAISPDGRTVASAGADGTLRLWSAVLPGDAHVIGDHDGPAWDAAFSPDGLRAVSGGQDGTVRLADVRGGRPVVLRGHTGEITDVAYSPDGRWVASTSVDGKARVWPTTGDTAPSVLTSGNGTTWSIAFSPDTRHVVISSDAVRIHPTTGRGDPVVLPGSAGTFRQVTMSPDSRLVAGAGSDGTVRVWRATGDTAPTVLRGHQGKVFSVRFSPDGRHVASGGHDGTIRIWSLDGTGEQLVLRGHEGLVWSLAYSADGKYIATAGNDGTVRIWRTDGNPEPIVYQGYRASVETVAFTPTDHRLLTSHDDGTVRIQDCEACGDLQEVLNQAYSRTTRLLTEEEARRFHIASEQTGMN